MEKLKTLEQLRAEKERAETQLVQEQHKLERLASEVNRKAPVPKRCGCKTVLQAPP